MADREGSLRFGIVKIEAQSTEELILSRYVQPDPRVNRVVESWPRLADAAARTDWEWSPQRDTEEKMTEDFLTAPAERPDLCCRP